MRRWAAGFVLALACPVLVLAGRGQSQEPDRQAQGTQATQRLEEISRRLELTPEQVERARPILEEEAQKLKALRDRFDAGGQGRRARLKMARELRDIQDEADKQLEKILSKQQMNELKKMRDERRARLRERQG